MEDLKGYFGVLFRTYLYARPNVTKYQVYQFFMSTKNLHIKSFTFIPSRLLFLYQGENLHIKFIILLSVANFF